MKVMWCTTNVWRGGLPRIFLRQGIGFHSMTWSELELLIEGISQKAARRLRDTGRLKIRKGYLYISLNF